MLEFPGRWWARQDLNLQPDRYERPALTIELRALERRIAYDGSEAMAEPHQMNDNFDPRTRRARLAATLTEIRLARQGRTTKRLLCVIGALSGALTLVFMRRYGFF